MEHLPRFASFFSKGNGMNEPVVRIDICGDGVIKKMGGSHRNVRAAHLFRLISAVIAAWLLSPPWPSLLRQFG